MPFIKDSPRDSKLAQRAAPQKVLAIPISPEQLLVAPNEPTLALQRRCAFLIELASQKEMHKPCPYLNLPKQALPLPPRKKIMDTVDLAKTVVLNVSNSRRISNSEMKDLEKTVVLPKDRLEVLRQCFPEKNNLNNNTHKTSSGFFNPHCDMKHTAGQPLIIDPAKNKMHKRY